MDTAAAGDKGLRKAAAGALLCFSIQDGPFEKALLYCSWFLQAPDYQGFGVRPNGVSRVPGRGQNIRDPRPPAIKGDWRDILRDWPIRAAHRIAEREL